MYALQMQTACQGEGNGEPEDPSSVHQEPTRPATQDCSAYDIVRATQVKLLNHHTILPLYTKNFFYLYSTAPWKESPNS